MPLAELSIAELWLPVLVAAVFVFIASSVLHMVIPIHKDDYTKMPGEAEVLAAMRGQNVTPGQYMFPCPASMKDMGSPEMIEKYNQGPVGFMSIMPNGPFAMGKSLVQWFVFSVIVGVGTAYIGTLALAGGAAGIEVFQLTGAVAFLVYGVSSVPDSIWKGINWTTTMKFVFDGLVYGLVTGAAFAWLWPAAA